MKKKILAIVLCVAMLAIAVVGGTMAYFTDTEGVTNVMTTGNVKIVQNEQERNAAGELVAFQDNHKLVPYTGSVGANGVANAWGSPATINGTEYRMFDQSKNAVDKIVTVTNEGTEEAFIRTLFAFEVPAGYETDPDGFLYDRTLNLTSGVDIEDTYRTVTLGNETYVVCVSYYPNDSKLAAKATSVPSLRQVYLNANVGNEWYDMVDGDYKILVLSQATQTQGFDDAKTALNTAFGDPEDTAKVTSDVLAAWFADCV